MLFELELKHILNIFVKLIDISLVSGVIFLVGLVIRYHPNQFCFINSFSNIFFVQDYTFIFLFVAAGYLIVFQRENPAI